MLLMKQLSSASEVVSALGGPLAVVEMTGRSYKSVWRWQATNRFPPATYAKLQSALSGKGCGAPPALWLSGAPIPKPEGRAA